MQEKLSLSQRIIEFFLIGIWRVRLQDLPKKKSFFLSKLRIFVLTLRKFDSDNCSLRASALTFYTLLSIVPVFAMAFGVAKGFGYENVLRDQLMQRFAGQEEVFAIIIGFAHTLLENTRGGMVAGIGVVVLLWTVIKVLYHIECSFNEIWEIKRPRSLKRKLSNYISIMVIGPVLLIASGSVTVFINSQLVLVTQRDAILSFMGPFTFLFLKFVPYVLIWAILTFAYIIMPNTKVSFKSALIGAVIAGTCYQFAQWGYINFQVGIARYNAIYGSFAALPLFLIWLEISWLIVLFGSEISYSHQNVYQYEFEHDCMKASPYLRKLLALHVTHLLVKNFSKGGGVMNAERICAALTIPFPLVHQILDELIETGIIIEVKGINDDDPDFQIAIDINELSINFVMDLLAKRGVNRLQLAETKEFNKLVKTLDTFKKMIDISSSNKLLKDI
ncbi:MAG: YihY/virulence factor BrkB family protein [Thermodesulfobacteriota bacterium]